MRTCGRSVVYDCIYFINGLDILGVEDQSCGSCGHDYCYCVIIDSCWCNRIHPSSCTADIKDIRRRQLRHLLPASLVTGSLLLVIADIIAKDLLNSIILPVGAITALIGAPILIYLLLRNKNTVVS